MDVFDTATLRARVLATWTASPARFREDANAEDELARGAYRDRLVVELAQNAADAGARAGAPSALLFRLDGAHLTAANTGASLDAAGVESLSTLRASAKRDETPAVGRFGVGFAAVLAVSDEPSIRTADGGVRWSREHARDVAAGVPELEPELRRRGEAIPVLRLPFAEEPEQYAAPSAPAGYDTAVSLPLRDDAATQVVRRLLADVDDTLLLALPNISEIVVEVDGDVRTLTAGPATDITPADSDETLLERRIGERTWRLCTNTGVASDELLAGHPFEERVRPFWSVTVALTVGDSGTPRPVSAGVVYAPTPTDDRTDLPGVVLGSFPLDSSRRRVAPGPLTGHLVEQVGSAYATLVASFVGAEAAAVDASVVLGLVPGPLGVDELDAELHHAIRTALSATAFVPVAGGGRHRPGDVVVVDGLDAAADPAALAGVMDGLPAPGWARTDVLAALGATIRPLSDVVDELAGLHLEPASWRHLYAALDGTDQEALAALPVPLADGRVVRGPRGALLPGEVNPELVAPFDLRVVAPDAVHPLLRRLGAAEATATSVLRDPMVRAAVAEAGAGDDDPRAVADAILGLVADAGVTVADEPWLAELPLPDETGTPVAANELFMPGSPILPVLDADPAEYTVNAEVMRRHGHAAVEALGVRSDFTTVSDADVVLDDELWHDLDDEDEWVAAARALVPDEDLPPVIAEFVAVRDLDLIREDAWSDVLPLLAAAPTTRAAVVDPAFLLLSDGTRRPVPSYTAWWLRRHARIDGHATTRMCAVDAHPLVRELLHPVDVAVDEEFAGALGIAHTLADIDADVLLERLVNVAVDAPVLTAVYTALAVRDPVTVEPPSQVRVPDGLQTIVVAAMDAVVCDAPYWLQLGLAGSLPAPAALADVLDLDLASETVDVRLPSGGRFRNVSGVARDVVPEIAESYIEHDDLRVMDVPVSWWVENDTVHASTLDGLARGLAWAAGRWERRWLLAEALRDPEAAAKLISEDAYDVT